MVCQQAEKTDSSGASPGCGTGCKCLSGAQKTSDWDEGGPAESSPRSSQARKQNLADMFVVKLTTKEIPEREEIWSRSSVHMCFARNKVRMPFSKRLMRGHAHTRISKHVHPRKTTQCCFLGSDNSLCLGPIFDAACDINNVEENISTPQYCALHFVKDSLVLLQIWLTVFSASCSDKVYVFFLLSLHWNLNDYTWNFLDCPVLSVAFHRHQLSVQKAH